MRYKNFFKYLLHSSKFYSNNEFSSQLQLFFERNTKRSKLFLPQGFTFLGSKWSSHTSLKITKSFRLAFRKIFFILLLALLSLYLLNSNYIFDTVITPLRGFLPDPYAKCDLTLKLITNGLVLAWSAWTTNGVTIKLLPDNLGRYDKDSTSTTPFLRNILSRLRNQRNEQLSTVYFVRSFFRLTSKLTQTTTLPNSTDKSRPTNTISPHDWAYFNFFKRTTKYDSKSLLTHEKKKYKLNLGVLTKPFSLDLWPT